MVLFVVAAESQPGNVTVVSVTHVIMAAFSPDTEVPVLVLIVPLPPFLSKANSFVFGVAVHVYADVAAVPVCVIFPLYPGFIVAVNTH